jgi:protein-disulfide isomerase
MLKTGVISSFLVAALATSMGCSDKGRSKPSGSSIGAPAARDPKAPVARIGSDTITEADLNATIKSKLARIEAEHAEQVHGLRTQALNDLVEKRLLEAKAKKEGITPEKLVEREVTAKLKEPSDSEIQTLYDQAKASGRQLPPIEQVKPDIVKFLKDKQGSEARRTYIDGLKAESKVQLMLPPLQLPRVEVAAEGPSRGPANAPITIVEFSDYECPYCSRAEESVKKVLEAYKGKVRVVYRDFPLPFHSKAQKASEAALCAGDQGKFWEMHEKLFANQQALDVPQLKDHAKTLGLDGGKFEKCLDSGEKAKVVEASKKAGEDAGVSGTPAFFINGRMLSGAQPFEKFKEVIDSELASGS